MTNIEYSTKLVNELHFKKVEALKIYEKLKTSKSGLDPLEAKSYLKQVKEYHDLAELAERVMKKLLNGSILPTDQISRWILVSSQKVAQQAR
jgi:hypothetical protein